MWEFFSKFEEVVWQQPPALPICKSPHNTCKEWLFSAAFKLCMHFLIFELSLQSAWFSFAIILGLCHYCGRLEASWLTLYGFCGWRRVSGFPCLPRLISCSPQSGPQRTSPCSERLQKQDRKKRHRGITAAGTRRKKEKCCYAVNHWK